MTRTPRTEAVLRAIDRQPCASNVEVSRLAAPGRERLDQGQVSKLLGRLERLGLIARERPAGGERGMPNSRVLTDEGHALLAEWDADA